ncbi:DNA-3-methyladenine glycosylase family protein [Mucilaginibacter sp.]
MQQHFDHSNFHQICNQLAAGHPLFNTIIERYGYPPMWSRPNTFETLVHVILEQQVSLASALSALHKLKERVEEITPERVLLLTDEELKACYFSRQKTVYVKNLAGSLLSGQLDLAALPDLPDEEIRRQLTQLKGIGNWTTDIYLMMVLHHPDVFPAGDLAIIRTLKMLLPLPPDVTRLQLTAIADSWRPYRTVAAYLLWHYYLSRKLPVLKADK